MIFFFLAETLQYDTKHEGQPSVAPRLQTGKHLARFGLDIFLKLWIMDWSGGVLSKVLCFESTKISLVFEQIKGIIHSNLLISDFKMWFSLNCAQL